MHAAVSSLVKSGQFAALALALMLSMRGTAYPADGTDQVEQQQSAQDVRSRQNTREPDPQAQGTADTKVSEPRTDCGMLETAAIKYGLPVGFFIRLIRQESNFDPKAISRAGAIGIAQFMPGTARWRGLADPFDPTQALQESARWLSELRAAFGNLGLAAAAYNAGPQRVKDWMAGRGNLPTETRAYVRIVTGQPADAWLRGLEKQASDEPTGSCTAQLKVPQTRTEAARKVEATKLEGWGLRLTGDGSESQARAEYASLQHRFSSVLAGHAPIIIKKPIGGRMPSAWYFVTIAEPSHESATQLCSRLRSAGGSCLVMPYSASDRS